MFQFKYLAQISILFLSVIGAIFLWEKVKGFKDFFKTESKVTQNLVLNQVTAIGKIELVNFQFRDVVESELQKTILPNSKALLIISGQVIGCIDLAKIKAESLDFENDSLIIELPNPEICSNKIDHSQSKVYDVSLFSLYDQSQLIDEAYKKAELQISDSALQMGIIEQTKQNADKILKPMLEKISGKKVRFFYKE
ncbi:MAG: DUF4230 domain-containing protein [Bacteroidota bacterium]